MNSKFWLKIKLSNHVELSTNGAVIHLPLKSVHKLLYSSITALVVNTTFTKKEENPNNYDLLLKKYLFSISKGTI